MEIRNYRLPPTALMPNSPRPLLHYPGILSFEGGLDAALVYDKFASHGWNVQWIMRYGPTQEAHYHSAAHECMAVLSGTATIRFGVADLVPHRQAGTHRSGKEDGGLELLAKAGDVFVLPAGTAHKTFDARPNSSFKVLTPGDGHQILARDTIVNTEISGFTMIGAYPTGSRWDFQTGGEDEGDYERVWSVPKPDEDPILGSTGRGLGVLW